MGRDVIKGYKVMTLASQFETVSSNIQKTFTKASRDALEKAADQISYAIDLYHKSGMLGFSDVTGNLWKSLGVITIRKTSSSKSHTSVVFDHSPGRLYSRPITSTLEPGEDLLSRKKTEYYSGLSQEELDAIMAGVSTGHEYVKYKAPKDSPEPGRRFGDTERRNIISNIKNRGIGGRNKIGKIVAFYALPYADYRTVRKNRSAWDTLAEIFSDMATDEFIKSFKLPKSI